MGIPRFYRYMSERYPLLNQPISDVSLLPEFDCFYLDMNGIIHNCTHTDAADSELNTAGLPAQLHNIFTYLDRLITHIIKPKQLVYIAIDGVAPRAKLNQQRSRRFRAGMEREQALEQERHKQIRLEDEKNGPRTTPSTGASHRFDSNAITPGTPFLTALSAHLVWFVRYKMKTDPLWSRLEVFFSGSEVPGEGEHKIVDFIRHRKMAPGYAPNVRHCMYGSDADLMLLGIMTHEPHFTLVREVVVWGSQKSQKVVAKKIEEEQWQLVHLSLFREYLMMELRVMPPLDGERMLDDFILLTYLLGNDFIPHSPTLEISEDAIPLLLRVYRELLDKHDGQYLTENGQLINIPMLQDLFKTIGDMEEEILLNRAIEEAKRHGKHKRSHGERPGPKVDVVEENVRDALSLLMVDDSDEEDVQPVGENGHEDMPPLVDDEDDDIGVSDEDEEERLETELLTAIEGEEARLAVEKEREDHRLFATLSGSESFQDTKWTYYERKFGLARGNCDANNRGLADIKKHYMEAIVWCLHYYFQGPPSWSWYYPYHYAPMISDLTDIGGIVASVKFGKGPEDGPLLPFEQLMANLPASSAHLVPEPYRFLMVSPLSPIKHFYPEKFEIDMEGKRNAWEGVNILPFIDVALLKSAIAQYCPNNRLTEAERKRNRLQLLPLRITYDRQAYDTVPSTMPGYPGFPDILTCHTRVSEFKLPDITVYGGKFQSRLMDGVTLPMAGFPSLYTLPLEAVRVEHIRVNCFGMGSRKATLILQLPPMGPTEQAVNPDAILGKVALVNWPNLHEALVVGVSTLSGEYRLDSSSRTPQVVYRSHDGDEKTQWAQYAQSECYRLLCGRGTPGSGGVDLGKTGISCCLHVLPLQGMISNPITGAVEKKFGETEAVVPFQLAVINRKLYDERFQETGPVALEDRFPKDSVALITRGQWLGCTAKVVSCNPTTNRVTVNVNTMDKEPPFGYIIAQQLVDRYFPGYMVAQKLGISTSALGAVTGSVNIKPGDFDIGLNLRFRKELVLPGYCRLVSKASSGTSGVKEEDNVWKKGDIVQIVGSGVSITSENGTYRPSVNGKGSATTWEYTERTISILAAYKAAFPEIFISLDKLPFATSYHGKDIFGLTDKKKIEAKAESIIAWIDDQKLGKSEHSKHIPITSEYVTVTAMRAIEAAGALRAKEREKHAAAELLKPIVTEVFAGDLFRPNPMVNQDLTGSVVAAKATKNPGAPRLGDRIINISARGVPFGQRGTVVATHVSSKCVEVLFDEGFTGGEPLYGSTTLDRGKIVSWNNIMCVSVPAGQHDPRLHESTHATMSNRQEGRRQSRDRKQKDAGYQTSQVTISSNYRKPRNAVPAAEPVSTIQNPTPLPQAAPTPPLPDPAKLEKLIKKWSHKEGASLDSSAPPSVEAPERVPEAVNEPEALAPAVAALFMAHTNNATPTPPPPPLPAHNALNDLFPHLNLPNLPVPPASHDYPVSAGSSGYNQFVNPYSSTAPQYAPHVASAPVANLSDYPPLSAASHTAKKSTPNNKSDNRKNPNSRQKMQWAPKNADGEKMPEKKATNLLLPSQVMRQHKPAPSQ